MERHENFPKPSNAWCIFLQLTSKLRKPSAGNGLIGIPELYDSLSGMFFGKQCVQSCHLHQAIQAHWFEPKAISKSCTLTGFSENSSSEPCSQFYHRITLKVVCLPCLCINGNLQIRPHVRDLFAFCNAVAGIRVSHRKQELWPSWRTQSKLQQLSYMAHNSLFRMPRPDSLATRPCINLSSISNAGN